ncbi:MAG TPA: DUF938 domain-containing protein [Leucothrix mucor]|nr:DUF938 domain-containing protein [Leucothrix mucor]
MKPYAESCDQNRNVILNVIKPLLLGKSDVLEIGSGTGQHAIFFAKEMPHLVWHTSDRFENHAGIHEWINESESKNILFPLSLDVSKDTWPKIKVDAIFSANTLHIMSWKSVIDLVENAGKLLSKGGLLIVYGPFNYHGKYTSDSNEHFDAWLKNRDINSGIRDFEVVNELASNVGLILIEDFEMPANNRILQWEKI